ncbi:MULTISPECIES: anti-sigma factor family protein [unclassified Variovorax]|uniref:anti-sigma factor family protein n=1 Tax=unclassified Variovorax TaxID=663243 RepID=UPI0013190375|nr:MULTISPECIES: anti-sigma factor [unclassified Variovorax]VTU20471.1 putative transmembrane transcriptional regulator (anti-sigma factor) [Variovorax sp. SRS16]VTU28614.1 putative transmembrane transcriptional regulator (anti-sigma factor) [Variovorax sp. PBL-E5]
MNHPTPPIDTDLPAWRAQRDALRQLHSEVLDEAIPPALLAAAGLAAEHHARQARWMRWGGMAASVAIAFGAGWLANGQWSTASGTLLARAPATREFVHAAEVAHVVYAPEKRHPVEVAAAEQQHLAQWLSKRLDKALKVPDLSAQGYALVGGRLLPGSEGARAQFMFERAGGDRVTLYIGSLGAAADPARAGETAFRFSSDGPVPSFYWVDHGFGYALAGALPRDQLMSLATAVYRQLEKAEG